MEGMIPIEEFKENDELSKIKVGTKNEVFLERIESFKGEIIISRDSVENKSLKDGKVFETQEEMTGYITYKVWWIWLLMWKDYPVHAIVSN